MIMQALKKIQEKSTRSSEEIGGLVRVSIFRFVFFRQRSGLKHLPAFRANQDLNITRASRNLFAECAENTSFSQRALFSQTDSLSETHTARNLGSRHMKVK